MSAPAQASGAMRALELIGYTMLGVLGLLYLLALLLGMIAAFPWGLLGLVGMLAFGLLFIKVLVERMGNREDSYYERNVDQ